ncbi:nucleoside phosphatase family-domain-containing protein [Infundibulicybe gibba]|nr:nucleoside phosphatase family-domain-containing protein [Infundibulicybe gibba]
MTTILPKRSNYEKVEGGMGPTRTDKKRFAWKPFAIGVLIGVLVGVGWAFGPRDPRSLWGSFGGQTSPDAKPHPYAGDIETDPLPGSSQGFHHDSPRPKPITPASYETDPDPSKTTRCTVPYRHGDKLVQYAVVIDAEWVVLQIHIYKFNNCGPSAEYEYEVFKMTQPGLYAFVWAPEKAVHNLDALLDEAVRVVPESMRACTPVAVKATALLHVFPGSQSADILDSVRRRLTTVYPFQLQEEDGVAIMGGKDKGVYTWIAANYLLNTIRADTPRDTPTYAVLDLGRALAEIVFEPTFSTPDSKMVEGDHKYDLQLNGKTHVLYQHSYLGYGLIWARRRVHMLVDFTTSIRKTSDALVPDAIGNPCLSRGTRKVVEIEDERSRTGWRKVMMDGEEIGSFDACDRVVKLVMAKDVICDTKPCSFNGVYQPSLLHSFPSGKVLLLSYFFDRLDPLLKRGEITVSTIADTARAVCLGRPEWLKHWGSNAKLMVELEARPEWCLDLTFIHGLLRFGYEFEDEREVAIGNRIEGTEPGWCLGAAIAMVDGDLKCRA